MTKEQPIPPSSHLSFNSQESREPRALLAFLLSTGSSWQIELGQRSLKRGAVEN